MEESQQMNPPRDTLDKREADFTSTQGDDHKSRNIEHI